MRASFVPALAMVHPPPAGDVTTLPAGPSNVAVTEAAVLTTQAPVPVQPPPFQPVKVDPLSAVAVSVTVTILEKLALHVAPQSIEGGVEMTFPVPVPPFRIVTV